MRNLKADERQIDFLYFISITQILNPIYRKRVQRVIEGGLYDEDEQEVFNHWREKFKKRYDEYRNKII